MKRLDSLGLRPMTDQDIELVLLVDLPRAAEQVAQWYFDEWGRADGLTLDQVVAKVSKSVGRHTAPMLVLAKQGGELVGAAELKIREMDLFPEYEHWLGGVYVDEPARGQSIGSILIDEVLARAKAAGIEKLYLQTKILSGGLYKQHGFEPLQEVDHKDYRALVMVASIGTRK